MWEILQAAIALFQKNVLVLALTMLGNHTVPKPVNGCINDDILAAFY